MKGEYCHIVWFFMNFSDALQDETKLVNWKGESKNWKPCPKNWKPSH